MSGSGCPMRRSRWSPAGSPNGRTGRSSITVVADAVALLRRQIAAITTHWTALCDEARLTHINRRLLATRQFFNPFAFEGLAGERAALAAAAAETRAAMAG